MLFFFFVVIHFGILINMQRKKEKIQKIEKQILKKIKRYIGEENMENA